MRRKPPTKPEKPGPSDIKSVMFVPYTSHSELATRLRDSEEKLKQMTGYRFKIVEKVGNKLVDLLHKADPWAGEKCDRENCLLCETKVKEKRTNAQDCHKRNCVYQTYCITCTKRQDKRIEEKYKEMGEKRIEEEKKKAKRFIYIGETSRSVFERGLEHKNDVAG